MSDPQPIVECASIDDLARRVVRQEASRVGIVVDPPHQLPVIEALAGRLEDPDWRVTGVPADLPDADWLTFLASNLPKTLPAPSPREATPEASRDDLLAELRRAQVAAQERIAVAKQQGANADPFDRDVAGWLAAGLCDLFADRITGESFLEGAFARLATDPVACFVEADFLRPDGLRFMDAVRSAQSMLTKLSLASTNQFRAAAVRLMNQLKSNVEAGAAAAHPKRVVFVGTREDQLRELLSDDAALFRYIEKPAVAPSFFGDERERVLADWQRTSEQLRLFQQHGLLASEHPDAASLGEAAKLLAATAPDEVAEPKRMDDVQARLAAAQRSLVVAWRRWFAEKLADIDAEWFLRQDPKWDYLDVPRFMDGVRGLLLETDGASLRLPASEADFEGAETFIAALKKLDREWRTRPSSPDEEGMAFDAAVAAGGAPLDLFTGGVEWWLNKENKDWHKYRIVRVD
jgi:hypothetical protein